MPPWFTFISDTTILDFEHPETDIEWIDGIQGKAPWRGFQAFVYAQGRVLRFITVFF